MTEPRGRLQSHRAAFVLCATLMLSGCSLVPVEENTFDSTPLPATTQANAETVLERVDETMTAADATRDPVLLAEIVGAPLLDIRTARYAIDAAVDPEDAEPAPPVVHTDPTVFIPRFEGYPQWFVVAAPVAEDGPLRLEILTRETAAAPWVTLIAPEVLPDTDFPELELDDAGYVVPLSVAAEDVPTDVAALVEQHAAVLGGAEVEGLAAGLAEDTWTQARQAADAAAAEAVGEAATLTSTYAAGGVVDQALRTADGGALVFYALTGSRAYTVTPTYFLTLDATTAAIVGTGEVATELTEQWAAQLAVYVPPAEDGVPRVVAATWDRTGLTGS